MYELNKFISHGVYERINEDKVKEDFERIAKVGHPKILSFNEANSEFIISNNYKVVPLFFWLSDFF